MEGLALMKAWGGEYDERFVRSRMDEVRRMLDDETLTTNPGVHVESGATENAYRQWAAGYDTADNGLLELDLKFEDAALDGIVAGVAVDTACGTGRIARRLAAWGHDVTGFDTSVNMLEQARRNVPTVDFRVASMDRLPLDDGSIDVVTNALAMTHHADLEAVLTEFARVLRPGGSAIISDVHADRVLLGSVPKAEGPNGQPQQAACHPHTVADYLRAALSTGFRVRAFDELPREHPTYTTPLPPPQREIKTCNDWPWTLLRWGTRGDPSGLGDPLYAGLAFSTGLTSDSLRGDSGMDALVRRQAAWRSSAEMIGSWISACCTRSPPCAPPRGPEQE